MAPVKMWTPYIPHLYTDLFWSIQKRDKFIPNYFELLSIYEIIYIRLFSIYRYLICLLVDVCCKKGVHIFLVSKL